MKKNLFSFVMFMAGVCAMNAKPVDPAKAKNVAISFYKQNSTKDPQNVNLAYTETSTTGEAIYYVFNVNDGFVIVSADDQVRPIIGYSTKNSYVIPTKNTTIASWMNTTKQLILDRRASSIPTKAYVKNEWNGNFSSKINTADYRMSNNLNTVTTVSVDAIVQSTWNQNPYYNQLCPSTDSTIQDSISVTGCNATAMSQIMRFWSYPPHGYDSSSYCDCGPPHFARNYGTLSANYSATTYNWVNMPLNITSYNIDIATLNFQCGVSVNMDYAPSGSGSYVITADDPNACAQISYVKYFAYDSTTIQGLRRSAYSDADWVALLDTEFVHGRPVQYVGTDPSEGGHTWVCDGFDGNNMFHMNWGWGGQSNGFYSLVLSGDSLNSGNGNYCCSQEALIGIQPPSSAQAGIASYKNATQFNVYPNPAHSSISVKLNGNATTLSVTDIMGQTIMAEQKVSNLQLQSIDISNFASGVYFIKVISKDNQATVSRFIKN